jgi:hypothetical protein
MAEIIRSCPDCGWDRPFAQHHAAPDFCPDTSDACCPEWFCPLCGTAVIVGGASVPFELQEAVGARDRAA